MNLNNLPRKLNSSTTHSVKALTSDLPVPLDDIKAFLIIQHDEDDDIITRIAKAVQAKFTSQIKRPLVSSTVTTFAELYSEFMLPYTPVASLTSVSIRDNTTGAYSAATSDQYFIDGDYFTPYTCAGRLKLVYTAGYSVADPIPDDIQLAYLTEVTYRYENRNDEKLNNDSLCDTAEAYLKQYYRYD